MLREQHLKATRNSINIHILYASNKSLKFNAIHRRLQPISWDIHPSLISAKKTNHEQHGKLQKNNNTQGIIHTHELFGFIYFKCKYALGVFNYRPLNTLICSKFNIIKCIVIVLICIKKRDI